MCAFFLNVVKSAAKRFAPFIIVAQIKEVHAVEEIATQNLKDASMLNEYVTKAGLDISEECLDKVAGKIACERLKNLGSEECLGKIWDNVARNSKLETLAKEMHDQLSLDISVAFCMDFCMILGNCIVIWNTITTLQKCEITKDGVDQFINKSTTEWQYVIDIIADWDNQKPGQKINAASKVSNQYIELITLLAKIDVQNATTKGQRDVSVVLGICTVPFILSNIFVLFETWSTLDIGYKAALVGSTTGLVASSIIQFYGAYKLNEWVDILSEQSTRVVDWRDKLYIAHTDAQTKMEEDCK